MLAIIGGTGLYQIQGLETIDTLETDTPFGSPSAPIIKVAYRNTELLFLPRHGNTHERLPHEINYPANIFALKKLGATASSVCLPQEAFRKISIPGILFSRPSILTGPEADVSPVFSATVCPPTSPLPNRCAPA